MTKLTLEAANAMIAAALAKARELKLKPLGVAVMDAGGHLIAFQREDTGAALRLQIAMGKASGALALGMSSRRVADVAAKMPQVLAKIDALATAGAIPAAGALLIGGPDGAILGAVAATGDTSDADEACARAGIEAAGFTALE